MSTKNTVLEILTQNIGKAVSGEVLAQECGVSRTSIWKAVNSLRREGCAIRGTQNGGYALSDDADIISAERIRSLLQKDHPEFAEIEIQCHKELDSTISHARRILAEPDARQKFHRALIVAESQTDGIGRLGRKFYSPQKTGIYLSVIYTPQGGIQNPAKFTALAAVAVCRALKKLYSAEPKIKWVNDVFAGGKKVCGILTEGVMSLEAGTIESAIVGIGINIADNPAAFPSEVAQVAGSVIGGAENHGGNRRAELAAEVAAQCLKIFAGDADAIAEYKRLSFVIGQKVQVCPIIGETASVYEAEAVDITEDAGLVVRFADGTERTLNSGEVSLRSANFA